MFKNSQMLSRSRYAAQAKEVQAQKTALDKIPHLSTDEEINIELTELENEIEVVGIVDVGNDEFHNYDSKDYWTGETILVSKAVKKTASIFSGGMNLLNSIIGAGILSLPSCVASLGVVFGAILIVLVGALSFTSMVFIANTAERVLDNYIQFGFLKSKAERESVREYRRSMDVSRSPRSSMDERKTSSPRSSVDGYSPEIRMEAFSPALTPSPGASPRQSIDISVRSGMASDLTGEVNSSTVHGKPGTVIHPDLEPVITFPWVTAQIAPWVQIILDVGTVALCVGLCDAYFTLIGSNIVGIIGFFVDGNESSSDIDSSSQKPVRYAAIRHRELWISVAYLITLPFCCMKHLSALRYLSYFNALCITYLGTMIVAYFIKDFDTIFAEGYHYDLWPKSASCISKISVIVFAYACHVNFMPIFDEAGPVNRRKRAIASGAIACGAAGFLYLLFGVFGRFIGGESVPDSIIDALPNHDVAVMIARFAVVFIVTCGYPLLFYAFRISVVAWLENIEKFKEKTTETQRRIMVGVLGSLLVWALAMAFSDLGVILSITGATGATITTFIIPGYMLWAVYPEYHNCCSLRRCDVPCGLALSAFGIIFMFVAIIFTFVKV